ncbi:hypothetical protein J6590_019781 [Homalodisca vitripennis]|nr:hypothetical protein J6590_019781 [Homalodisca vitripennis]
MARPRGGVKIYKIQDGKGKNRGCLSVELRNEDAELLVFKDGLLVLVSRCDSSFKWFHEDSDVDGRKDSQLKKLLNPNCWHRYDVRLSYEPSASKSRLTRLDEIIPSTENIFFIETRCGTAKELEKYTVDSGVVLNARQICAIESTARLNPSRPVYLLHTCPLDDNFPSKSPEYVRQLLTYNNVHVVMLDLAELFMRSIVEELYFNSRFEESRHPVEHVSDVIRLLVLWRFGGTYMDIDVVSIRPLDELGTNYAGWQDEFTIASGVLNFAPDGFGHHILTECLFDLRDNFEPHEWSTNGPLLITKTIMRLCGITYGGERISRKCREFTDYPIPVFYPIYYTQWQLFFDEKQTKRVLNLLNDTYVVHLWNKMSSQRTIRVGSGQAYGILAAKYCPKAYRNCGVKF